MDAERIKQTVDYIKARHKMRVEWGDPSPDVPDLLEITDHLQKTIDAQEAEIERLKKRINDIDPERKS